MEFPNVNFTTDAMILDGSFNDSFPKPINEDAFQNSSMDVIYTILYDDPTRYQMPLVPIPKLKSQALAPAPKSNKRVEKKKSEIKQRKFLVLCSLVCCSSSCSLFFIFLFGGLVPLLKDKYGGMREPIMS